MPVSYVIVDEIVVIAFTGYVYDRELVTGQKELFGDPAFDGDMPRLVDATQVCDLLLSARVVREVAQVAYMRGMRRAALVSHNKLHVYGLMRMYQEYLEQEGDALVELFSSQKPAIAWLRNHNMAAKYAHAD